MIEFSHVGFRYRQGRMLLNNFSLRIEPQQRVALVGPSGAGKTTIIKILLRLYDVTKGKMKSGKTKELEKELAVYERVFTALENGKMAQTVEADEEEEAFLHGAHLLTRKPILYVVNVGEDQAANRAWTSPLGESRLAIPMSVKVESELMEMAPEEQVVFLEELGFQESGLDRLIGQCYRLLGLMTFFTSGEKETRAWTVKQNTKAPQAAGVIHTDSEKGFIRAEVIHWKDFVDLGEVGAKENGKLRIEGKEYVMQDGDVCHFRVNT